MKKIFLSYILILLFNYTNAQSCLNINSNPDLDMDCTIACFNVNVQVPDIKSTESYQVISTPYNPFALTGGTAAGKIPSAIMNLIWRAGMPKQSASSERVRW